VLSSGSLFLGMPPTRVLIPRSSRTGNQLIFLAEESLEGRRGGLVHVEGEIFQIPVRRAEKRTERPVRRLRENPAWQIVPVG